MTFSIVALDPESGALGVAVASRFPAVGAMVPWARAGVGALASQAFHEASYGPRGLALLAHGVAASDVVARLTGADPLRDHRQLAVVDADGGVGAWTGPACIPWAGGRTGPGVSVQGNLLVGPSVVEAMLEAWASATGSFARRLIAALRAGDEAGGDLRGRQAAAVLVALDHEDGLCPPDRWLDWRSDDHAAPIDELTRLLDIHDLVFGRPDVDLLLPLTDELAAEITSLLARQPTRLTDTAIPAEALDLLPPVGEPRPLPAAWDADLDRAFHTWLALDNLDGRRTAPGWIDPLVLDHLRSR